MTKCFRSNTFLLIRCAYPESVPARHGGFTALAAGKVHQVDLASDAVLVLLSLHQLRLDKIKGENKNGNYQTAHLLFIDLCFKIQRPNKYCYTKGEKIREKKGKHTCVWVIMRVKTEWDLELLSFIPVAAVARCLLPRFSQPFIRNTLYLSSVPLLCTLNQYLTPSRHFHFFKKSSSWVKS